MSTRAERRARTRARLTALDRRCAPPPIDSVTSAPLGCRLGVDYAAGAGSACPCGECVRRSYLAGPTWAGTNPDRVRPIDRDLVATFADERSRRGR